MDLMMKILIFGKNGQVGSALVDAFENSYDEVIALDRFGIDNLEADFTKPDNIENIIRRIRPDIIFNAVAYTAVDKAEIEPDLANLINCQTVETIANVCRDIDAFLVHYSTDYIFDGSGDLPHNESSLPKPINVYGQSKLKGEYSVINSGCKFVIFRTSWVYSHIGHNFVKTIINLAHSRSTIDVVSDQIGTPTSAKFIAEKSVGIARKLLAHNMHMQGVYNLVPDGFISWSDFARCIIDYAKKYDNKLILSSINDIKTSSYKSLALRPLNSKLDNTKIKKIIGKDQVKEWKFYLRQTIDHLYNI